MYGWIYIVLTGAALKVFPFFSGPHITVQGESFKKPEPVKVIAASKGGATLGFSVAPKDKEKASPLPTPSNSRNSSNCPSPVPIRDDTKGSGSKGTKLV